MKGFVTPKSFLLSMSGKYYVCEGKFDPWSGLLGELEKPC